MPCQREAEGSRRGEHERRGEDDQLSMRRAERRVRVERRLPMVDEGAVSFSDWVRSMARFLTQARKRAKARSILRAKPK